MATLSKRDRQFLQDKIADAEKRIGAHLALVIVPASDRYLMYPLAYGALFALALGGALALFWAQLPLRVAFVAEAAAFAAFSLLFDWLPLRLLLVPRSIQHGRARNLAHREFAARILTTHRGGLLVFVSLGERYVELLADRDLHAKVGQAAWDKIVADLTSDVRNKPLNESLVAAIEACTDSLRAKSA